MDDLYIIFREKVAAGVTAIHPHRWLHRECSTLSIGLMQHKLAHYKTLTD